MKRTGKIVAATVVAICGCRTMDAIHSGVDDQQRMAHEVAAIAIIQKAGVGEMEGAYALKEIPSLSMFVRLLGDDREKGFEELQRLLGEVKEIGPPLAARFIAANRNPQPFRKDQFPAEFSVVLLPDAKLEELFANGPEKGWRRFYEEFKCFGMVTASQPVFSEDGKSALIMVWHQYGPLQGEGGFVMAKRIGRSWTIFDLASAPTGVSSVPNQRLRPTPDRAVAFYSHPARSQNPLSVHAFPSGVREF